MGQRGPDHVDDTAHVDRDHLVPFPELCVDVGPRVQGSRGVDDDVEPPKFADGPRDRLGCLIGGEIGIPSAFSSSSSIRRTA
jgi:hypothetical protein